MNVRQIVSNGWHIVGQNLPAILTGLGIVGVVGTAYFAGKGTLEADKKLKEYEEEKKVSRKDISFKEKLKVTYKYYIPATIAGLGTVAAIVGSNRISAKQLAVVATVAKTAEQMVVDNREAVKEVFGDKGLIKVDDEINQAHADKYFKNIDHVFETGHGSTLCCEGFLTGTLFRASPEWIHMAVNEFNARLIAGEELCYNDFITTLIPNFDNDLLPDAGYKFSYNIDVRKRLLEITEYSGLLDGTKEPYLIFNLREMPLIDPKAYYQDHMTFC